MLYLMDLFYSKNKMRDRYKKLCDRSKIEIKRIKYFHRVPKVPLIGSFFHIHVQYIQDKLSIINGNIVNDGDYLYVYAIMWNDKESYNYQQLYEGIYEINIDDTSCIRINGLDIPIANIYQINKKDKVIYYEKDDPNFFIHNISYYTLVFYNEDINGIYTGIGAAYPGDMISFKGIDYSDGVIDNIDIILPDINDVSNEYIHSSSHILLKYNIGFTRIKLYYHYYNVIPEQPHLILELDDGSNSMYNIFSIQIGEPAFWKKIYEIAIRQKQDLQYAKDHYVFDENKNEECDAGHELLYKKLIPRVESKNRTINKIRERSIKQKDMSSSIPIYRHIFDIPKYEEYDGSLVYVKIHSTKYSGYVIFYRSEWIYAEDCADEYTDRGTIKQAMSIEQTQWIIKDMSNSLVNDRMVFRLNDKHYTAFGGKLIEYHGTEKPNTVRFI